MVPPMENRMAVPSPPKNEKINCHMIQCPTSEYKLKVSETGTQIQAHCAHSNAKEARKQPPSMSVNSLVDK